MTVVCTQDKGESTRTDPYPEMFTLALIKGGDFGIELC